MSSEYFIGGAAAIAEVTTLTPGGTITTGDVDNVAVLAEDGSTLTTVSFTVGGTTTATAVVTGLKAAWNGNAIAAAYATASGTTTLILTAASPGIPFYVTPAVTGVGTLTGSNGNTTANSGPNDWNTPANWSGGAIPANSDNVTIDGRATAPILYGLKTGLTSIALTTVASLTNQIAQLMYPLQIGCATLNINVPPPDGSRASGPTLQNFNLGSGACVVTVFASRSTGQNGLPPVQIKGSSSSNTLNVLGGSVGVATALPGDTATIASASVAQGASLTLGIGTTITTVVNSGGNLISYCAIGTLLNSQGVSKCFGAVEITTANANGGTIVSANRPGSGSCIGTLNLNGGNVDMSQGSPTFAIGAINSNTAAKSLALLFAPGSSFALSAT